MDFPAGAVYTAFPHPSDQRPDFYEPISKLLRILKNTLAKLAKNAISSVISRKDAKVAM
jgi:hypothetical protein